MTDSFRIGKNQKLANNIYERFSLLGQRNLRRLTFLTLFIILLTTNISGLSCGGELRTEVNSLDSMSGDKINVSGLSSFSASKVREEEGVYNISKYEEIALNSLNDETNENYSRTYEIGEIDQNMINQSDIMVSGPPTRACGYRFKGFVGSQKGMKAAIIDGSFEKYKYRGTKIKTSPGKNITCEKVQDPACSVSVNFQIGDEKFELQPNQTYRPESKLIESIELLNAKKNFDWEWNTQTYSNYIIYFSPENKNLKEGNTEAKQRILKEYITNQFFSILRPFL